MLKLPKKNKDMFAQEKTDWNLLAKYFAGETNDGGNDVIAQWLEKSPANRKLFNNLKSDQKIMDTAPVRFNVDNAWDKLHKRIVDHDIIQEPVRKVIPVTQPNRYLITPFRIAASLLFLAIIGASLVFLASKGRSITVSTASNDRVRNITLPDGSAVYLNANTRLAYSKKFNQKTREVALEGEAFFEVSPDKNKPFLIRANGASIRVVGTSFNVNAKKGDSQVEVYVSTGIVEIFETGNQRNRIVLNPGFSGTISQQGITSEMISNENQLAWRTGNMDFSDTKLLEVVEILNNVYKAEIVCLEPGLDSTRINGSYRYQNDPLDTILNVICTQNHLKVEKSENKIYLSR
ncbi:MAG TPA: FecR domain-containing protein [Bacteroidales bacterium]|nr:FecR domain-containing protein [Bacteroidales bacterium]